MHFVTTAFLLTAALTAQSIVFPSTHTTIANGASSITWFPLSDGVSRQQIVFEGWDLNIPANTPITRIGFRHDPGFSSVARQVQLEVRVGASTATAATMSTTYDSNFTGSPTTVFPLGLYGLPPFSSGSSNSIWYINFTTPFLYTGGNLVVEFRVFANNNGNQSFSYGIDRALFVSPVTNGVPGCMHAGGQVPTFAHQPTAIGTNWTMNLSQAPASAPVALLLAVGQTMPAPYSLAALGIGPSCLGQMPGSFAGFSGTTNTFGSATWSLAIPANLALNYLRVTGQVVALDIFSPGSLVVSNASQVDFGVAPRSTILWHQGSATAATGSVYANYGVVTFFN
jgi:hypothetical protein